MGLLRFRVGKRARSDEKITLALELKLHRG
jgi:hypothetical protein